MKKLLAGCLSLAFLAACSGGNNDNVPAADAAAPTETAQEFVARVNDDKVVS